MRPTYRFPNRKKVVREQFTHLDAQAIFQDAWNWLWANLWDINKPYITASELHRRVRSALQEKADGKGYGKSVPTCTHCLRLREKTAQKPTT